MILSASRDEEVVVKLDDTGLSVSYLSPLFHTLSVQFLIPSSSRLYSLQAAVYGSKQPLFIFYFFLPFSLYIYISYIYNVDYKEL